MDENLRIARCKVDRLKASKPALLYATHVGYTHALLTMLECVRAKVRGLNEPVFGSSCNEIKNRLIGMVIHVRDRGKCSYCSRRTDENEQLLLRQIEGYLLSEHSRGKESFAKLSVHFPSADGSSGEDGGDLYLLDAWRGLVVGDPAPTRRPGLGGRTDLRLV